MEKISKYKEEILNYFKENYPNKIKVEFEVLFDNGLPNTFLKLMIYDSALNRLPINADSFFSTCEKQVIYIIENNNIMSEDEINKNIKADFIIDINNASITIDFYEIESTENYLGNYSVK